MTDLQKATLAQIKQLQDFALMMATIGEHIQTEAEDALKDLDVSVMELRDLLSEVENA